MRHWQANGVNPHLVRGFKISRDPKLVEKFEDMVGLQTQGVAKHVVAQIDPREFGGSAHRLKLSMSQPWIQA